MARPEEGFPGKAPGTGKAEFNNFPPDGAPVEPPAEDNVPPQGVGTEPPVDPATGLPLLPIGSVLEGTDLTGNFSGQVPDDIFEDLLF